MRAGHRQQKAGGKGRDRIAPAGKEPKREQRRQSRRTDATQEIGGQNDEQERHKKAVEPVDVRQSYANVSEKQRRRYRTCPPPNLRLGPFFGLRAGKTSGVTNFNRPLGGERFCPH